MKNQRYSRQRQLVLEAVLSRRDHPSADEIYLDVRTRDSRISRGTVYRNLRLLSENGEIMHVKVPSADRYDWRLDKHYHLICTECGRVSDIALEYDPKFDERVFEETGYAINRHRIVFEGVCPECLASQTAK